MKRMLAALLAAAAVLSLTACGKKKEPETQPSTAPTAVTEAPYTAPIQVDAGAPTVPGYELPEALRREEADIVPTAPPPTSVSAMVTADFVLIRSGPSAKSKNIGRRNYGDTVTIYEAVKFEDEYWARIDEGWMTMLYLKPDGPIPAGDPADGAPAVIWGASRVNVREEPDVESKRVTKMARNSFVRAHETKKTEKATWVRINQGWVSSEYILLLEPVVGEIPRIYIEGTNSGTEPPETTKPKQTEATKPPETTAPPTVPETTEETQPPTTQGTEPPETNPPTTEATVPSTAAGSQDGSQDGGGDTP